MKRWICFCLAALASISFAMSPLLLFYVKVDEVSRYAKEKYLVNATVYIETIAGHGSGVIIAKNNNTYYVLTCDHVIRTSRISFSRLEDSLRGTVGFHSLQTNVYAVLFDDNNEVKEKSIVSILSQDIETDLAIVSFDSDLELPVVPLLPQEQLSNLEIFTPVIAVGCQAGFAPYPTTGIFADQLSSCPLVYLTTADISYGSSGGGVFVEIDGTYYLLGISSSATIAQNGQILTHMAHTVVVWDDMELLSEYVYQR